jgi:hypothetical protein
MATKLDLAEAQLLGYTHGKRGYYLKSLIESMGLTKKEWYLLKDKYPLNYLNEDEIIEINEYFSKND